MTKEHKILHKIKDLHSSSSEFRAHFDKDREAAIKKHFGDGSVKILKESFGKDVLTKSSKTKKVSIKNGNSSKAVLEHATGGKGHRNIVSATKQEVTEHDVSTTDAPIKIKADLAGDLNVISTGDKK